MTVYGYNRGTPSGRRQISHRPHSKPTNSIWRVPGVPGSVRIVAITVAATVAGAWLAQAEYPLFTEETPGGSNPCRSPEYTARNIVLDSSDPVTGAQARQMDELIERFLDKSRKGDFISVVLLTHDIYDPINILFSACDPGGSSEHSLLVSTPSVVDEHRWTEFVAPLHDAVAAAKTPTPRPRTPLIEGIYTLSQHATFRGGIGMQPAAIEMLILSDMLQHTSVSAYRGDLYLQSAKPYVDQYFGDLAGARVEVGLIHRAGKKRRQTAQHWAWCQQYLGGSNVESVTRHHIM